MTLARLCCCLALGVPFSANAAEDRWAAFSQRGWRHHEPPSAEQEISLILALRQRGLAYLEERAMRVSDPDHHVYGQYYLRDEVNGIAGAADADVAAVESFLRGVPGSTTQFSKGRDLVRFTCAVTCVERLFRTKLMFQAGPTQPGSSPIRAAAPILLPAEVAEVLDGVSLNAPIFMPSYPKQKRHAEFVYPASGRKAPRLDPFLIAGDEFVSVRFVAFCKDGRANNARLEEGICSSPGNEGTEIVSFEILVLQYPNMQTLRSVPAVVDVLGQREADCGRDSRCIEFNATIVAQNYANTTVKIRAHFSDGSVSHFSDAAEVRPVWLIPYTTPTMLSNFYGMPLNKPIAHPRNTIAVVEFQGQYYNPADLQAFFQVMGVRSWDGQSQPRLIGKDMPVAGSVFGGEAQLDLQYIMAMAANVTTVFWSVPGTELATKQEPFLEWLMQVADSDDATVPLVHSVSYGDEEEGMPSWFKQRVNTEFMKLALRGITILVASGDDGVSGSQVATEGPQFCRSARPEFPATSPWVTAVGGTQLSKAGSPVCSYTSDDVIVNCQLEAEVVCTSAAGGGITTGGGFSDDFPSPWYQKSAVQSYLQQTDSPVPHNESAWHFNARGRAYPDVSAVASNYLVWMGDHLQAVSGTSASTPLVAAMVAHWNELRLQQRQPPLGFMNPLLYKMGSQHPEAFNDILIGDNRCSRSTCCEIGFGAARGWDAVSGFGSPKFDVFMSILGQSLVAVRGDIDLANNVETVRLTSLADILLMTLLPSLVGVLLVGAVAYGVRHRRRGADLSGLSADLLPH